MLARRAIRRLTSTRLRRRPAPPRRAISTSPTTHTFQAETKQLLDIVAKSVYTEKEVFVRELISNASDALEKLRYLQTTEDAPAAADLQVSLTADADARTLTIADTGVGMTPEELRNNLGVIARSGSKAFVQQLSSSSASTDNIIGQFGVGFYSVFMVADRVEVRSTSAASGESSVWASDGSGEYTLAAAADPGQQHGTTITLHLREDAAEFADPARLESTIRKYSNFVGFPIHLNGERQNTVRALWAERPSDVTDEEYNEFYKLVSASWEAPQTRLHFTTDVPIDIKALLYFPQRHMEKFGMGRLEPGVSLYSRKVLIKPNSPEILPDWLRFVRGVVDSEDLPLNLSRESMQDAMLLQRISRALTKKVIRALDAFSREEPEAYRGWIREFGQFIKEGVCTDQANKNDAAKLLRYETSGLPAGEETSLDDYVARMQPEQRSIYFVVAENRELAERSPYFEHFRRSGVEVLFLYSHLDDFVMRGVGAYAKKPVLSIEAAEAAGEVAAPGREEDGEEEPDSLTADQQNDLAAWLHKHALTGRVSSVSVTARHLSAPAILVGHESASVRSMMRHVNAGAAGMQQQQQGLEINPAHPVMRGLHRLRDEDATTAQMVAEQVFDNALIAAGLLDNPQTMVPRITDLLVRIAKK